MNNTSKVGGMHSFERFLGRAVLGAALLTAAAAFVALGDNGLQDPTPNLLDDSFNSFCSELPVVVQEEPAAPAVDASPPARADGVRPLVKPPLPGGTNGLLNLGTNGLPLGGTNAVPLDPDEPEAVPALPVPCSARGRCVNDGVSVHFTFTWCCEPGTSCYLKIGTGWLSLAQWLRLKGGGCIVRIGCN